jgi:30S ribosomal protein S31
MTPMTKEIFIMGKGDRRTKRGKIWRGTTGKVRTKKSKSTKAKK